jgi:enoyl-CoA hydratase
MKYVSVEITNHIAIVTLDRAPVNALVKQCYSELYEIFSKLGETDGARVAVLRSPGTYFCPGNDVKEFTTISSPDEAAAYAQIVSDGIAAVYNCEIPVIAAVQGHALGAGMAIAASADVVIAADCAEFGIPEIKVGVIGAAGFLALLVPEKVVRYMSLSGEPISAQQVERYGGVHKIVDKEQVFDAAMEVAATLLQRGPAALRYFKAAMNTNQNACLAEKYAVESSYTRRYVGTAEAQESIAAFLENRPADYNTKSDS